MPQPVKQWLRKRQGREDFAVRKGEFRRLQQECGDFFLLNPRAPLRPVRASKLLRTAGETVSRMAADFNLSRRPSLRAAFRFPFPLLRRLKVSNTLAVEIAPVIIGDGAIGDPADDFGQGALQPSAAFGRGKILPSVSARHNTTEKRFGRVEDPSHCRQPLGRG